MPALLEKPVKGPLFSIVQATQRLNPVMELDVDVLAVTRAAAASTAPEWAAGTLTNTAADTTTGILRLDPPTPVSLFSQTAASTVHHFLQDAVNGVEEYALDFFPDPNIMGGVSFTLASLDLHLRMGNLKGVLRVQVSYYDENWHLVPMGPPIDILSGDIVASVGTSGGVYTIDFLQRGYRYVFEAGFQNTSTGVGYDGATTRTANLDAQGVSHLRVPRGLSISILPVGPNATDVWIGLVANATAAQFDVTQFWRTATNRNCGPYDRTGQPYSGATTDKNPDNNLITGAVPGYGAKAVTNGSWGIARRIPTPQRAQGGGSWEQPYHNLKVVSYPSSGTAVNVLDMGAVPTNPVELRLDDVQQQGTTLAYSLKGSNTASTGPWTLVDANAYDGEIIAGSNLYRWYQLTTTFTPGPTGATKYASPALQAWMMVERVVLSTYRYLKDFDSTTVADPVTAQSQIGELKLPVMNAGRQDFRDLASQLGSNYAFSGLEAHVYARNTRSGVRYFLNSYRLENREPQFGAEEMTFVSGMDRLTIKVPAATETFRYPGSGQATITNVTNVGAVYTITVAGTPYTIGALVNYRMHGVTGVCAKLDFTIASNPTTSQFTINIASGAIPAIGDTFEIHSDQTTRVGASYVSQDFAAIYTDLLGVQAAVPSRYRGRQPATTGRTGSYTIPADGAKALDVIQDVALHCGGFPAWDKGRIQYVDFYGPKVSAMTWSDRHIVSLETPVGADRRMPRLRVKYGYQSDTQKFTNQATYDDFDTIQGWGLSNLFDVFELPDAFCKWNDSLGTEAKYTADTFQKAWKSGVRIWKVRTVLNYPWLTQGDAVTILADQYTDRRLAFSADGLTDIGTPVAGRTSAVAVIVGKNLWGNEFVVAVRGLDQITSAAVATTGTVAVPPVGTQAPVASITPLNTEADDTVWNFTFAAVAGTGGGGANLTYTIKSKSTFGADTTLSSGNATSLPLNLGITRDARMTKFVRFTVTDTLTGLTSVATWTVTSQRGEIDSSGRFKRAQAFDDTYYSTVATNNSGLLLHSGVQESGTKPVNRLLAKALAGDPDTLDGTPEGTTYKRVHNTTVNGSGYVDFSKAGFANKDVDNVSDGTTYKKTTANQRDGGGRGYDALYATTAKLNGSYRLPAASIAGGWSRLVVSSGDRNDMAASNVTSSAHTISVGAFALVFGDAGNAEKVVSYNATTVTDQGFGLNYVYSDENASNSWAGGTPTLVTTTIQSYMVNLGGQMYIGKITTAAGSGSGAGAGGPVCTAPETLIWCCDKSGRHIFIKRADEIQVGDYVWTQPDRGAPEMGAYRVMKALVHLHEVRSRVVFEDGRVIVCSAGHRLRLMSGGWSEAQFLRAGEKILGQPVGVVESVSRILDIGPVVQLSVKGARTYVSNGLLSHNQKAM